MAKSIVRSHTTIIIITTLVTLCVCIGLYALFRQYNSTSSNANENDNLYTKYARRREGPVLQHASSSVDSELQYDQRSQWKGQPSKCYSCETDMASRCGNAAVYNATKQKLFSG